MQDFVSHGLYQSTAIYVVGICALLFWNKIAPRDLAFVSDTSRLIFHCSHFFAVELCYPASDVLL